MENKIIVINTETFRTSILKDLSSSLLIIVLGIINYKFMGQSEVVNFFVVIYAVFCFPSLFFKNKGGHYYYVDKDIAEDIEVLLNKDKEKE